MKKYTEKDLESFERNEYGDLICPTGDYTAIKAFSERCSFDVGCSFSDRCSFGELCSFNVGCSFGERCGFSDNCSFGKLCSFDRGCRFGVWCSFGEYCRFGESCIFGERCRFGEYCRFGGYCSFGELCRFGELCSHEGLTNSIYVAIDRIGSNLRKTYFFKANEGYFVRAGCFFGTLDAFKTQVHKTHRGTIHETTYLMACDLAVKLLDAQ